MTKRENPKIAVGVWGILGSVYAHGKLCARNKCGRTKSDQPKRAKKPEVWTPLQAVPASDAEMPKREESHADFCARRLVLYKT